MKWRLPLLRLRAELKARLPKGARRGSGKPSASCRMATAPAPGQAMSKDPKTQLTPSRNMYSGSEAIARAASGEFKLHLRNHFCQRYCQRPVTKSASACTNPYALDSGLQRAFIPLRRHFLHHQQATGIHWVQKASQVSTSMMHTSLLPRSFQFFARCEVWEPALQLHLWLGCVGVSVEEIGSCGVVCHKSAVQKHLF